MFAGYFAFALALKARYRNVPLWAFLLATQLCDWVWLILSVREVEHFRLYFTLAGTLRLDLYDVFYSHSLFWTAMYALLTFLLFVRAEGQRHWAVPLALAVFSHWILDWLMCAPVLPFANFGTPIKFGIGLGNIFPFSGVLVEGLVVASCWWAYDRRMKIYAPPHNWERKTIPVLLIVLLLAPQILQRLF